MKMKIHTKGITGSRMTQEGEEPGVMFASILEIDGHLIDRITRIRVLAAPDEIASVMVRFVPGTLDTITHTDASWDALMERLPQ